MGGFCPICKIYLGGFCPSYQKRVGGGDSVRGGFCPDTVELYIYFVFTMVPKSWTKEINSTFS